MPEGQFTGKRATYDYVADDGSEYRLTLDETLGSLTGTGMGKTTTASTSTEIPKRLKPRVVYWQGALDGRVVRKALVCNTMVLCIILLQLISLSMVFLVRPREEGGKSLLSRR